MRVLLNKKVIVLTNSVQTYGSKSYWLEDCDDQVVRQALEESQTVDVAILGAGFTGLWTAYYLLAKNPSLNIAILDKKVVGFGASGRNGGWCSPKFSVTPPVAIERFGVKQTKELFHAMIKSVNEVERVIKKEKMEVDWKKSGSLKVSIGKHLLHSLEDEMKIYKKIGMEDSYQLLSKDETDKRVRINGLSGSILTKPSAVLHPGKLVKQLAKVLEQRGVKIYEHTEVKSFVEGDQQHAPQLITDMGSVTAKSAVVIAGEAFLSQLPEFRRSLIPMYTSIVLTEPLSNDQWAQIGWENRETIGSNHLSVDYLQRTADGRILFGLGNSSPYRYASHMDDTSDTYEPSLKLQKRRALQWFPMIKESQFTHEWGGPIGVTRDWTPNITFDKQTRIAHAWGYAGQGVSTTNLAGRILSNLIYETETLETTLPMVHHTSPKWEPEPFRWLGAKYVKFTMNRLDRRSEYKGVPPTGKSIAERLIRH